MIVVICLLLGIVVARTVGMAVFDARRSTAEGKPRRARLKFVLALTIAVGGTLSVVGGLVNEWVVRALGICIFLASFPMLIALVVTVRTEFRNKTKS
jgi:UPF0716 family protein affecting phage T7 exclusion